MEVVPVRTNIVIDEDLIQQAMAVSGITTKRELVDVAIREFLLRRTRKDLRELRGGVFLSNDYDYKQMRENR